MQDARKAISSMSRNSVHWIASDCESIRRVRHGERTRTNIKCDARWATAVGCNFHLFPRGLTFISDNVVWYSIESRWNARRNAIKEPDPLNWKVSLARYFAFNFGRVCVCASCCPRLMPRKIVYFFATSLSARTTQLSSTEPITQLSYTFGLLNRASLIPI